MVKLSPVSKKESKEQGDDQDISNQDLKTASDLTKIENLWVGRDKIIAKYKDSNLPLPVAFATDQWDAAIREIVEQSVEMRNPAGTLKISSSILDFDNTEMTKDAESVIGRYPGFSEPPKELSPWEREENNIVNAFMVYQKTVFRAKYFGAIYDSLSWLDDSVSLSLFAQQLEKLNKSLIDCASLSSTIGLPDGTTRRNTNRPQQNSLGWIRMSKTSLKRCAIT